MSTPVLASVLVAQNGSTPIGMVQQSWTIGGTPTTVYVQASAIVDPQTGVSTTVDANGLHVVTNLGSPVSGVASNTSITGNSPVTLVSSVAITNGKTGTLQHGIFCASGPMLWQLQTVNNSGSPTTVLTFMSDAFETYDYVAKMANEISSVLSTGTTAKFQVVATPLGTNQSAIVSAYANFIWAEN